MPPKKRRGPIGQRYQRFRRLAVALGVPVALTVPAVLVVVASAGPAPTSAMSCIGVAVPEGDLEGLDAEQIGNADIIDAVGRDHEVPARGRVVAVATALQESSLRNLPYGDLDSLGLFQQRALWGPADVRTTPADSAEMFYTGGRQGQAGLLDIPGWQDLPLTVAAQAVQRSKYPEAYARWEPLATELVRTSVHRMQECSLRD